MKIYCDHCAIPELPNHKVRVKIVLDLSLVRFETADKVRLRGVERKHETVELVLRVSAGV